ncbi:hypothetical protein MPSEU_000603500 [Mayamaea pseudoterrestris]|nr:hypothetical protein MPSEU_000603500 [Mayamaea pseudoterrestris]
MSLFTGGLLSGDIWNTGAFSFESPLKDLLDSGDYTLEQLLAEDELLQELRGLHPKLIEFLSTEQAVTQLIHYVIDPKPISMGMGGRTAVATEEEAAAAAAAKSDDESNGADANGATTTATILTSKDPSEWLQEKGKTDDPEMLHIRYPFMACEIFCCEIDGIINLLVDGRVQNKIENNGFNTSMADGLPTRLLDILFSLLTETPVGALDDYRAGYFEKLLRVLFKRRPVTLTEYLRDNKEQLIPALLQHLYCHSIMQIAQRLLTPHKPTPKRIVSEASASEEHAVLPAAAASDNDEALLTPAEDGEDDVLEPGSEIKCEWASSEHALNILLESLVGEPIPLPDGGDDKEMECDTALSEASQEQRLELSLNASEVLIMIVQNSLLSSPQMLRMTSTPVLERLILGATTCRPQQHIFSCRESLMTSVMSVLESLILQLGGYGAVGIMSLVEETSRPGEDGRKADTTKDEDTTICESQVGGHDNGEALISNLLTLIDLLPYLLENLSELLTHPSTVEWKSCTQFSKEPLPMLGCSRLRIVRILEALVLLGDPDVDFKLVQSDCLEICLDFFWEFQWCSMLHQSVANLLVHVFEGGNARVDMQEYFLIRCNILVRLMDSFQEVVHATPRSAAPSSDVVLHMNNLTSSSNGTGQDSCDNDPLPISEDDVDAAIEQDENKEDDKAVVDDPAHDENVSQLSTEAVHFESRGGSSVGAACPAQAFRYGYMGHVIIICQALVHACAQTFADDDDQTRQSEDGTRSVRSTDRLAVIKRSNSSVMSRNTNDSLSASRGDEDSVEKEPLFLAEMVRYHPLSDRWDEFVNTVLASETTIQSTPLGGYSTPGGKPRRPGLADDGDAPMGYDGQPALPARRFGELDMDDNDLDIAANMMADLHMGRGHSLVDDDEFSGSGDSNRSYNSGETNNSGGYLFDDPLGKDTTGLGIELGKLTKLRSELASSNAAKKKLDECDASSSSSKSSSSAEEDEEESQDEDDTGAPVMDLFAGNFCYGQPSVSAPTADFDFANFDDAFAGASDGATDDEFGAFVAATPDQVLEKRELDEIFQPHDSAEVLDLADADAESTESVSSPSDQPAPAGQGTDEAIFVITDVVASDMPTKVGTDITNDGFSSLDLPQLDSCPSDEVLEDADSGIHDSDPPRLFTNNETTQHKDE